jgi:uncharacterized membrane protein
MAYHALKASAPRYWEVDAARAIALLAMVAYHAIFVSSFLGLSSIDLYSGWILYAPYPIAGSFLLISGLSLKLDSYRGGFAKPRRRLRRFLIVGAAALAVSVVTLVAVGPEQFVAFGVLHCIAVSGVIALPFLNKRWLCLGLGLTLTVVGFLFMQGKGFSPRWSWWVFPIGFRPSTYYPVDFVPLVPWFGFFLIGIFAGSCLYRPEGRAFTLKASGKGPLARALCFLGRHSLEVYLAHVPLLIAAEYGLKIFLRK